MPFDAAQEQLDTGIHLVLYDGVCGLCNRLLQFALRHDRGDIFRFASLQSPIGRAMVSRWGGDPEDLTSFYVISNFRSPHAQAVTKADAALLVARELGWPWKLACVGRAVPKPLRNRIYGVIARNRYRMFGRYEQCVVPTEESRSRFVD